MNRNTIEDVLRQIGISIATYMLYYGYAFDEAATITLKRVIQTERNRLPDTEEISEKVRKFILAQCDIWAERDDGYYLAECKHVCEMYKNAPLGVKSVDYLMENQYP